MSNDIQTLLEFLDRCGPEVTGHAAIAPPELDTARLQRFIAAECDKEERAEICRLLRQNPRWLAWVAEQLRAARKAQGRTRTRN